MKVLSGTDLRRGEVVWAQTPEEDYDGPTTITWWVWTEGIKERAMETRGWISHGRLYAAAGGCVLWDDIFDSHGQPRTDLDWYDVETGAYATVEEGEMRVPMGLQCAMCRQPVRSGRTPRYVVSETVLEPRPDGTYQWTSAVRTGIVAASFQEAKQAYEDYLSEKGLEHCLASCLEGLIHDPAGPAYWVRDVVFPGSSEEVSCLNGVPYMAVIVEVYGDDPQALRT